MKSAWTSIGATWAALGVAFGAFGAHAIKDRVGAADLEIWRTAVLYHLLHALALVLYGLFAERSTKPVRAGPWFLGGSVIFSSSLYALALGGPRWLGALTPFGGSMLIAGWSLFAFESLRDRRQALRERS